MIKIQIFVQGSKGKRELTNGPVPMDRINAYGVIVLTPMPEPIKDANCLAITFLPDTKGPQFLVNEGETLSFEVKRDPEKMPF